MLWCFVHPLLILLHSLLHVAAELVSPVNLLRCEPFHFPGCQEEDQEIEERYDNGEDLRYDHDFRCTGFDPELCNDLLHFFTRKGDQGDDAAEDLYAEVDQVNDRKPFHLDRQDSEEIHAYFREQHGKGKEGGQVDVVGADIHGNPGNPVHGHGSERHKKPARENVQVVPERAHVALQTFPYEKVQQKHEDDKKVQRLRDGKYPGKEPPHLSLHHHFGIEYNVTIQANPCIRKIQDVPDDIPTQDVIDQIPDRIFSDFSFNFF